MKFGKILSNTFLTPLSIPICSHINFYSLTLKWHFDLFWPLWPLFGLFCNFFQLLNIHFNVFNKGASWRGTIILAVGISKLWFLGAKNGPLLNRERIVPHIGTFKKNWIFIQTSRSTRFPASGSAGGGGSGVIHAQILGQVQHLPRSSALQ